WKQPNRHHHYNVGTTSGDWYKGELNEKGIPLSTMRDGTPKGYAFIDFDGNRYSVRYKVVDHPEDYQMQIFAPKLLKRKQRTSAGIYVNFFMGESGNELRVRVNNGNWVEMNFVADYDPAYLVDLYKDRKSTRLNSSHVKISY